MRLPFKFMFVAALVCAISGAGAQGLRIAVMDFTVESDNPQFKYLGKGFAELASVEVARLPGFTLVDRERRNALLEEQAFSLSGAADAKDSIAIGKLLTVDYLVVGTVLDMFGNLVVTFSVIKTDSGEVVGKSSAEGAPGEYKRIVREIGAGIAKMSGKGTAIAAARTPPAAPVAAPPVEKQAEVLSSFSAAVEALDRKDVKAAAANLEKARKIDPTDPAVRFYLDKLSGGSSKFAVVPPVYYSLDNPASLGSLKKDMVYFNGGFASTGLFGHQNDQIAYPTYDLDGQYGASAPGALGVAASYTVREIDGRSLGGYALPLADGLGLGVQFNLSRVENNVGRLLEPELHTAGWDGVNFYGAVLSLGWVPAPWLSVGVSGSVGMTDGNGNDAGGSQVRYEQIMIYGGELGLIIKNASGNLVFSIVGGTDSDTIEFFDMDTIALDSVNVFQWPLYFDMSVAYGFNSLRDFIVLKFIQDIYGFSGEGSHPPFIQILPAFEHSFGKALSARIGGVVSMAPTETLNIGFGGNLGVTLTLGSLEFDLSGAIRQRPSRVAKEEIIPIASLGFGVRYRGLAVKGF